MTIEEYFGDWSKVINLEEVDKIVKKMNPNGVCPLQKDLFKAFHLCPLKDLRVCIIGQDPYPTLRQERPIATGIAFANSSDTPEELYSPSLGVLRESVIDFTIPHETINFDPSLEKWERQGVLLLNAALSCQQGKPGSHMLMWRPFMTNLLKKLSEYTTGIVYVLMGNSAISLQHCIQRRYNYIIRCKHPSYYARTHTKMPSDIWKEINNHLTGSNGSGIEWYTVIN